MTYDLAMYFRYFWGVSTEAMFLVSYFTFIPQLAIIPGICLYARFKMLRHKPSAQNQVPVFGPRFILNSLQFAGQGSLLKDFALLILLAVWPMINFSLVIYTYVVSEPHSASCFWHILISRVTTAASFILYTCFCYVIFVMRRSFAAKFAVIPEALENLNLEESKSIVTKAYLEYRGFRNLIGFWMTFTLSVSLLGLTLQTSYIYNFYKSENIPGLEDKMMIYSIMIWNQKLMLITQPMVVLGGINVDYLWKDLKRHITGQLAAASAIGNLTKLIQHMNKINVSIPWVVSTLGSSILGFYVGLQLPEQDLQYWVGPNCDTPPWNIVNLTEIVPIET